MENSALEIGTRAVRRGFLWKKERAEDGEPRWKQRWLILTRSSFYSFVSPYSETCEEVLRLHPTLKIVRKDEEAEEQEQNNKRGLIKFKRKNSTTSSEEAKEELKQIFYIRKNKKENEREEEEEWQLKADNWEKREEWLNDIEYRIQRTKRRQDRNRYASERNTQNEDQQEKEDSFVETNENETEENAYKEESNEENDGREEVTRATTKESETVKPGFMTKLFSVIVIFFKMLFSLLTGKALMSPPKQTPSSASVSTNKRRERRMIDVGQRRSHRHSRRTTSRRKLENGSNDDELQDERSERSRRSMRGNEESPSSSPSSPRLESDVPTTTTTNDTTTPLTSSKQTSEISARPVLQRNGMFILGKNEHHQHRSSSFREPSTTPSSHRVVLSASDTVPTATRRMTVATPPSPSKTERTATSSLAYPSPSHYFTEDAVETEDTITDWKAVLESVSDEEFDEGDDSSSSSSLSDKTTTTEEVSLDAQSSSLSSSKDKVRASSSGDDSAASSPNSRRRVQLSKYEELCWYMIFPNNRTTSLRRGKHRHHLKKLTNVFAGTDLVDWILLPENQETVNVCLGQKVTTRKEAEVVGQRMLRERILHHVSMETKFRDGPLLYRLQWDSKVALECLNMCKIWSRASRPPFEVLRFLNMSLNRLLTTFWVDEKGCVDLAALQQSKMFYEFSLSTAELQRLRLNGFSHSGMKGFLVNLYNILLVHGQLARGADKTAVPSRRFYNEVSYQLRGAAYTLTDILEGMFRGNSASLGKNTTHIEGADLSRTVSSAKLANEASFKQKWQHALPQMDPRLHFALGTGNVWACMAAAFESALSSIPLSSAKEEEQRKEREAAFLGEATVSLVLDKKPERSLQRLNLNRSSEPTSIKVLLSETDGERRFSSSVRNSRPLSPRSNATTASLHQRKNSLTRSNSDIIRPTRDGGLVGMIDEYRKAHRAEKKAPPKEETVDRVVKEVQKRKENNESTKVFVPFIKFDNQSCSEQQLDELAKMFINLEVSVSSSKREVVLPRVFKRYAADFGRSETDALTFLLLYLPQDGKNHKTIERWLLAREKLSIRYNDFDWRSVGIAKYL
ncbi:hypothetical protein QOT17_016660 [Balamuthia mandrillaris]